MFYSKSVFVEFMWNPKLARWHLNDKTVYNAINEVAYGSMDGAAIGQSVEDMVKLYYKNKEIAEVDTSKIDFKDWHKSYHKLSMEVITQDKDVIYQWAFVYDDLFCKVDFLVKNSEWTYDIVEVKAKNNIRKTTKAEPLLEDLVADVSFQSYILKNVLGEKFSGNTYLMHLDKDYEKNWEIDPQKILIQEDVSGELFEDEIVDYISSMRDKLKLSKEEFEKLFPYNGEDHLTYFGTEAEKGTIRYVPGIAKKKIALYEKGKTRIADLDDTDIESLCKKDWSESRSSEYARLYQKAPVTINKAWVEEELSNLKYPLFFYDYETIPSPIPALDGTKPRQQTTVQYSVHKVTEDGKITHKEFLLEANSKDNKAMVDQFVLDLEGGNGTYIVWNEWFEKGRNKELAKMYPQYASTLEQINDNTYDLMLIFKKFYYFDRKFYGSASIKKVLPVMTDISYDGLAVPDGWLASSLLLRLQQGLIPEEEIEQTTKDLLIYCKQDTWAMVRIWEDVKKKIK